MEEYDEAAELIEEAKVLLHNEYFGWLLIAHFYKLFDFEPALVQHSMDEYERHFSEISEEESLDAEMNQKIVFGATAADVVKAVNKNQ